MEKKNVSIILFYDNKENILLQDRKEISKHGEEYGFFGGHIEKGETPEEALKREIKEELDIEIKNYKLFKSYKQIIKGMDREVTRHVYVAPIPDINNIKVSEGKIAFMKFKDSFKLKMMPGHIELLKEIYSRIVKK